MPSPPPWAPPWPPPSPPGAAGRPALLGLVGLERVDELLEPAGGELLGPDGRVVGLEGLQPLGGVLHPLGGLLQGEPEDGGPLAEPVDQLGGLVLQPGLDPAEFADAGPLGDRELAAVLLAGLLVADGLLDHLALPLADRLEGVAHLGDLLHGELLLGLLPGRRRPPAGPA